ncbi:hypothetical protein FRUB_05048 [Fimbriiglobus ruber]|uniref:Uncharacterized protein n=1 Tax=Fimbriiglobus ruber TaxID=1908690 RepID=A0A225DSH4_9BACT|nr:hypothetical protein FRUB_05048 [Fimbriiglobus ruber]
MRPDRVLGDGVPDQSVRPAADRRPAVRSPREVFDSGEDLVRAGWRVD